MVKEKKENGPKNKALQTLLCRSEQRKNDPKLPGDFLTKINP